MRRLEERLRALGPAVLKGIRRGIEKESLRVRADGALAATPHPAALGSALTHPNITTDFCEAQLELITAVDASPEDCIAEITRIHQFVVRHIGEEMLWCSSMPCGLPGDDAIPIGRYGRSNIGRAKSVYRMGLAWRYGRRMQTNSGIHYNFSLPERSDDDYFALIRNFRRHAWLLFYLYGASPAVCTSFVEGREHRLQKLSEHTLYLPHATSLRMGRLGYQSEAQSSIVASCNSLEAYGASLEEALTRPYPSYEKIGILGPDKEYRQLATSLIQIENEFYGKIRPKRIIRPGERPLHALRERGVEYVEVRLMDLDPFEPVGIGARTMHMLDVFLIHCLARNIGGGEGARQIHNLVSGHPRVESRCVGKHCEMLAAEVHGSRRRRAQPGQDAEQGGLPRTVGADQAIDATAVDAEIDPVERSRVPVSLHQIGGPDHRYHGMDDGIAGDRFGEGSPTPTVVPGCCFQPQCADE